jgi:hypothetical protein
VNWHPAFWVGPGNPYRRGRHSTVDLLNEIAFCKEVKYFFYYY